MSTDFTFAQVAPIQPLNLLVEKIEKNTTKIGFSRSTTVCLTEIDERGVFEETDDEFRLPLNQHGYQKELENISGIAFEISSNRYTAYILLNQYEDQYIYAFLDLSDSTFESFADADERQNFWKLINALVTAIRPYGGFGNFELAFEPYDVDRIEEYIFNGPANIPSLIGVIPKEVGPIASVIQKAGPDYSITQSTQGYYFLQHKDFD